MSPVLVNLSMMVGLVLGLIAMLIGLGRGVPVWSALFRALVVVSLGTVVMLAFFRYFNTILYRFLNEKLRAHEAGEQALNLDEASEE